MKVACVLLPLVLCYDVFWVFIQPHLSNSPSVMIIAATGGGSTESVPMVLRLPHINDPLGGCVAGGRAHSCAPVTLIAGVPEAAKPHVRSEKIARH